MRRHEKDSEVWQESGEQFLAGIYGILVPPNVTLETRRIRTRLRSRKKEDVACLIYPGPSDGFTQDDRMPTWRVLQTFGWKRREKTDGLLVDFAQLDKVTDEEIAHFARHWGPLWYCQEHPYCTFTLVTSQNYKPPTPCHWTPVESTLAFRSRARMVSAMIRIAQSLLRGSGGTTRDWGLLGMEKVASYPPAAQRFCMAHTISGYLRAPGGISFFFDWSVSKPKLTFLTGLGFIHLLWQQMAQLFAGVAGVYTCDACQRVYIRSGRKPQAGRENFCEDCGTKAAKRKFARRKRAAGALK